MVRVVWLGGQGSAFRVYDSSCDLVRVRVRVRCRAHSSCE